MYIVGMNGPPRSGKDTIGNTLAAMIAEGSGVQPLVTALSQPIREVVYALLGVLYTVEHYEANKDLPQPLLGGTSIRGAMITLSEQHVKPTYGQDFWAARTDSTEIAEWDDTITIITDFGFDVEARYFEDKYGPGNVLTVHLSREDIGWANDSRQYITPRLGCTIPLAIENNTTPRWVAQRILAHAFQTLGWTI